MLKNLKVKTKIFLSYICMILINLFLVIMGCVELSRTGNTSTTKIFMGFGVFFVIFGLGSGWVILKAIVRPVRQIVTATEQFRCWLMRAKSRHNLPTKSVRAI